MRAADAVLGAQAGFFRERPEHIPLRGVMRMPFTRITPLPPRAWLAQLPSSARAAQRSARSWASSMRSRCSCSRQKRACPAAVRSLVGGQSDVFCHHIPGHEHRGDEPRTTATTHAAPNQSVRSFIADPLVP